MARGNLTRGKTLPLLVMLAGATLLSGCATQQVQRVNNTPLEQASELIPDEALLDVGIVVFDTGIPDDETVDAPGAFPRLREAEARFFPYHLKNTLQDTGYWGAIRVVPAASTSSDLLVFGRISQSDGDMLDLHVRAEDATGREWLNRRYRERIPAAAYRGSADPYQEVFNQIANDLVNVLRGFEEQTLARVRQVAQIRFAAQLTPEAFGDYLSQDRRGLYEIRRLPAEDDPMMRRAVQIRQREHMFIDTLDGHFGNFYHDINQDYDRWRQFARDEAEAVRELRSSARWRTGLGIAAILGAVILDSNSSQGDGQRVLRDIAVYGGVEAIRSGAQKRREASFHEAAMQEVTDAFQGAVRPTLIDLQGETVRLTGSAEAQYAEWQRLMREIFAAETGFIDAIDIYSEAAPEEVGSSALEPVLLEQSNGSPARLPVDSSSASAEEGAAGSG